MSHEEWSPSRCRPFRQTPCGHIRVPGEPASREDSQTSCDYCSGEQSRVRGPSTGSSEDFLPLANLTWDNATCTARRSVAPKLYSQSAPPTLDRLIACLGHSGTAALDLGGRLHSYSPRGDAAPRRAPRPPAFTVWRATPTGCHVRNGIVKIPERAVLLLTGQAAAFTQMSFTGGAIVCAGDTFHSTFRRSEFNNTQLYVAHGASASLHGCTLLDTVHHAVASGPGTAVAFETCTFSGGSVAVTAEAGAAITVSGSRFDELVSCVAVTGLSSSAALEFSTLHGSRGSGETQGAVTHGGALRLADCMLRKFLEGVVVAGRASRAEVDRTSIDACTVAVALRSGARAAVRQCDIATGPYNTRSSPVRARWGVVMGSAAQTSQRASLQLQRCSVQGGGVGLEVKGGHAAAMLCALRCGRDALVLTAMRSRLVFSYSEAYGRPACCRLGPEDCTLRAHGSSLIGVASACMMSTADRRLLGADVPPLVALADTRLRSELGEPMVGVVHVQFTCVRLLRCDVSNGITGVRGVGGKMTLVDTHISGMRRTAPSPEMWGPLPASGGAAVACISGTLAVRGGSVTRCLSGVIATTVRSLPMSAEVCGVVFEGCPERPVTVSAGASADVLDCKFSGEVGLLPGVTQSEAGTSDTCAVRFDDAGRGSIRGCDFVGYAVDVETGAAEGVEVIGCTFSGATASHTASRYVCLSAEGAVVVERCSFRGKYIAIGVQEAVLTVRGCKFSSCSCGVRAVVGGTATVTDCEFRESERGLTVSQGANVAAQDCQLVNVAEGLIVEDCGAVLAAKRVTVVGGEVAAQSMCRLPGQASTLKLVDCTLAGRSAGVRLDFPESTATLLRCELSRCGTALDVDHGASARVRKTRVWGGLTGLSLGNTMQMDRTVQFGWCHGCSRPRAAINTGVTWAALTNGPPGRGARCSHDGASARVTLEDVEMHHLGLVAVKVAACGVLTARRVHISRCALAVSVSRPHAREASTFEGCTVTACGDGGLSGVAGWRMIGIGNGPDMVPEALPGISEGRSTSGGVGRGVSTDERPETSFGV